MPQPAPIPTPGPAPLSPAQLEELAAARRRAGRIRAAGMVAAVSGWSMAIFALLTLMFALVFFSVAGIIVGAGLGAIAAVELWGRALLVRFRPRGATVLALNQLALGLLILGYAAWGMYTGLNTRPTSTGDPDIDAMMDQLSGPVTIAVYGAIALYAVVVPGLTAWYYHSRARHVRRFLSETQPWVLQVLRA